MDKFQSKKFTIAFLGLFHVMIVWGTSLVCVILYPAAAANIVGLAIPVVAFVGTISTALIAGQSVVDYKAITP